MRDVCLDFSGTLSRKNGKLGRGHDWWRRRKGRPEKRFVALPQPNLVAQDAAEKLQIDFLADKLVDGGTKLGILLRVLGYL